MELANEIPDVKMVGVPDHSAIHSFPDMRLLVEILNQMLLATVLVLCW